MTRAPVRSNVATWALPALLLAGLFVRLLFVNNEGFKTDVNTYVAWALALSEHGFSSFYSSIGFADYPPGYFYVLAVVGRIWHLFFAAHDPGYAVMRMLVKLPAIFADLWVGLMLYAIVRRFASTGIALGAAALYLFNPATIYISASWGQVDSISGGLALLAVYLLLRSQDPPASGDATSRNAQRNAETGWIVCAWLAFGYSLLIKPQAAVLLPLLVAFAFVNPQRRRERLVATGAGIVAALLLALLVTEPFHASNPISAFVWLLQRYAYGSNVYPYNSVNAFNLWALRGTLWIPDSQKILGLPQYGWGLVLLLAAMVLIVWRYLQDTSVRALLESCAISTIAFFVLSTRMHERYLFDGVVFTIACIPFARRYLWGAVALSVVLFANLIYSLQYLHAVTAGVPGVNEQNLWGPGTSLLSLIAVGAFFWLGYLFLGGTEARAPAPPESRSKPSASGAAPALPEAITGWSNHWFDPRAGLATMRAPLDYAIVALLGIGNFVLSFAGYWWPPDKVFDEVYFARAGEEYLQNLRIYENTHPPLSKLLITISMALFGGMPHGHGLGGWMGLNAVVGHLGNGDNSYGWRFLDVVFGALVVMLLYVFAKRVTGSTLFATVTALLLSFDGMHFVQSRIATPEGFVVFFSTLAVYAFYRFWISSQVGERKHVEVPGWGFAAGGGGALAAGVILALAGRLFFGLDNASTVVATLYFACGIYLLVRYVLFPRLFSDARVELSYGEGSYALRDAAGQIDLTAADGGTIDGRGKISRGAVSEAKSGVLVYDDDPLKIEYRRDGSVSYAAPDGGVLYAAGEIRDANSPAVESGRSARRWLIFFTVALGLLVSSKWYGVMGFGVSFVVLSFIWLQRLLLRGRPALLGNPRGFRLDGAFATILFVSATVYMLAWVPDLARHSPDPSEVHNLNDVVYRQYTMYEYHHNLRATHPYSSQWWEWPLDYVPVAYFYQDHRANPNDSKGCCIYEITSMPNPVILWFGLFSVLFVGVLAIREWNKAYCLIVVTYLLQWLPWILSPRLIFAYHFYVNIPLICLCNAIVLQRCWQWCSRQQNLRWLGGLAVGSYVAAAAVAFIYFYPILAAHPIPWDAWHQRMWFPTWIIGPG
ncbi:MAG TPA: phospholipid carrier-dependent glycosyltransferase [Candidatus Cybelea sp.]|nr:phospholipid carrier-dependent glycosyltransferase [Candidatus Cybelea sp.]